MGGDGDFPWAMGGVRAVFGMMAKVCSKWNNLGCIEKCDRWWFVMRKG
jgi:hypothetical protein